MSSSPVLSTILGLCLSEMRETELFFAISQGFLMKKPEKSPESLMKIMSRYCIKAALDDPIIAKQAEEVLRNEPLELSNLHYLEQNPELLKVAFKKYFPESFLVFGIEIQKSTCRLVLDRKIIAEILVSKEFEWPLYYTKFAFKRGIKHFRVSVIESPNGNETRKEKIQRFLKELQKETEETSEECSIKCYRHLHFHFENKTGSHIYFKKIVCGELDVCRHYLN